MFTNSDKRSVSSSKVSSLPKSTAQTHQWQSYPIRSLNDAIQGIGAVGHWVYLARVTLNDSESITQ